MFRSFLILFYIFSSFAFAVTPNPTQNIHHIVPSISKGNKTIGDHIFYSFRLKELPFVPSFSISFQDPSNNQNILLVTQSITEKRNGQLKYQAEVIPFVTGALNFPSFNIFNNYIEPISITINSVIDTSASINLQPSYTPFQDYSDITLFLLIIVIAIIAFLLYRNFQQYQRKKDLIITPEKARNLWQEVANLFAKDVPEAETKYYYFESSELLKEYVSKVLKLEIRELTTIEINLYLKSKKLPGKELLLDILSAGDPVKFAKHLPGKDEISSYQKKALDFLKKNEPQVESSRD